MAGFVDEKTLQKDLDKFPSNFDLDLTNLTKDRVKNIKQKLNGDQRNTTKLKTEDIQISNFLSYLYFLLEDHELAHQYIDESLQKDPDNIIANTNKARFLLETGEISYVEEIITKLQELEKREDYCKRKCYAEADLAYAYSRSGPWYHQKAVDLYNGVLEAYPTEYAWKFGLGLTLLRQTHWVCSQADDRFNLQQKERTTVHVAELLLTVATKSDDPILCAKAYARLGKAMYDIEKGKFTNLTQEVKALDSKTCFEKAVEICPEEPSVLETCGQYARYRMELETSEKLLRKSLQIKPTCHAYHHLALTLKRRVECGLDRAQTVNSTEERRLETGKGQRRRDQQFSTGDNWRDCHTKGRNKQDFDSRKDKGQCNKNRYQYHPRDNPGQSDPSQMMIHPGYQYRNQPGGYPGHSDSSQMMIHPGYQYRNQPGGCPGQSDPSQMMIHPGYQYRNQPGGYPGQSDPSQMMTHPGYQYRNQPRGYRCHSVPSQMMIHRKRQQTGNRFHTPLDRYGQGGYNGSWYGYRNSNDIYYDDWSCYGNANGAFDNMGWNGDRRSRKQSMSNSDVRRHTFQGGNNRQRDSRGFCNQRGNAQKKGPSRCRISDQSQRKKEQNLRNTIKSPLKVRSYPESKSLIEAVALLEKTEELDQYALGIQYDKGIIYRMLGQIEKAVEVFKQIVSKKKYLPTTTLLTNVYEQLGLCLLELSKSKDVSPAMQEIYKRDGQAHLQHAVQIQSEIVANDPQFKEAWNSYPTLKELFSDDRDGKPRQLAFLHMLMGDHRDSISIYEELLLMEKDEMNQEDYINLLGCYKRDGQFEKCVVFLKSLECTTIFLGLPPSLIFDVYVDCAFHAYTTDNAQLAYQHFRRAFKVYGMFEKANEDQTDVDEDDEDKKDILILHTCAQKWKCKLPRNLGTILEDCTGLQYTINTDNLLGNALVLNSMTSIIQNIPCIIIMTHDSAEEYDKLYANLAIKMSSEKSGPQVLVASDDMCNMPDIAKTKPFILLPLPLEGAMKPNDQIPEDHKEWVKKFITLMKPN